ncbi:hypothetical protein KOR42_50070 [Thalassoglobus neptunius]|uniref:Uncharacterized protein n=1 Tax=Thalassoglobus neptunius TaxID=1938619 RepID=A0A5C5VR87_9PLAN|nr:hypothetical protein KOR42_50070 [Thalassoglobus neptunius]
MNPVFICRRRLDRVGLRTVREDVRYLARIAIDGLNGSISPTDRPLSDRVGTRILTGQVKDVQASFD